MPTRFETLVPLGDMKIKVTSDSYAELHQAAARITELDRDAAFLRERGAERVVPDYHGDREGNEYFGLIDPDTRRSVTFGQNREKGNVPFFPKGQEGYYDPAEGKRGAPQGERPAPSAPRPSQPTQRRSGPAGGPPAPPPYDEEY